MTRSPAGMVSNPQAINFFTKGMATLGSGPSASSKPTIKPMPRTSRMRETLQGKESVAKPCRLEAWRSGKAHRAR